MRLYKVEALDNEGMIWAYFETYKEALRCLSSFEEEGYGNVLLMEVKIPVTKKGIMHALYVGSVPDMTEVYPKGTSKY